MHLIDTHAHYNLPVFAYDWESTLRRSHEAGVDRFVCPAIAYEANREMLGMFAGRPDVSVALGIHPKRACPRRKPKRAAKFMRMGPLRRQLSEQMRTLDELDARISDIGEMIDRHPDKVVAVGEAGLDYSLSPDAFERDVQSALFAMQLEMSLRKGLPVVIHVRDAHWEAIEILRHYRGAVRGVVHCFAAGPDEAREYLSLGLLLGIGGKVTHRGCEGVREAVRQAPVDRLVLETDAPFVIPTGFSRNRNDSTAIPMIAETVADLRKVAVEEVAETTTENATRLFWGEGGGFRQHQSGSIPCGDTVFSGASRAKLLQGQPRLG